MHYFVVLVLLLGANPCRQKKLLRTRKNYQEYFGIVPRVKNGWEAKLGKTPYQVSFKVYHKEKYQNFCGGSIIGPNKVVSAAHCFVNEEKLRWFENVCPTFVGVRRETLEKVFVVAGSIYNTVTNKTFGQWRKLKSMYIPPTYDFPKDDIAVGFTRKSFEFDSFVNSIPFATVFEDYIGTCLVSGYGRISDIKLSDYLQVAHLDVISLSVCNLFHQTNMEKFICTSDIVSDVGKGDSGGPLVCAGTNDPAEQGNGVLIGVVSGNRHGAGSFFTRVSSHSRFIISRNSSRSLRGSVVRSMIWVLFIIWWNLYIFILFY